MTLDIVNIYIALSAFVWVHITEIPAKIRWYALKQNSRIVRILLLLLSGKPFNCELCITFWLVLYREIQSGENLYLSIMKGLIAGGCSTLIFKLYNKL